MHGLVKFKIHLHPLHITGVILGYTHDIWNWTVHENKSEVATIAHNLFGFDKFFLIKVYRATVWGIKDLNIGGTNLTHINYGNIVIELKFIDTIKHYQKRLAELTSTLTEDGKNSFKHLTMQCFNQHHYFSEIWKYLGDAQKIKILDITSEGKGIIPNEKIVDINSMFLTPEKNAVFEKTEFYSDLKQKGVSDSDNESSFYLYRTLKMKNLGDMNDLYNAQDVILLCVIGA